MDLVPSAAADDADTTRPPVATLRHAWPADLFAALPEVAELVRHPPREGEDGRSYAHRLVDSTTPEDAVTYISFAFEPKLAIWWGYECLRMTQMSLQPGERALLELVAAWSTDATDANRWQTMQAALFSTSRGPALHLALAVGWSGGAVAPNDPSPPPSHRTPRSVNAAVLGSLARGALAQRSLLLNRFVRLAEPLHPPM